MDNLFTCSCLNVQLLVKSDDAQKSFINDDLCQSSEFFKQELVEVKLNLDAIQIELSIFISKDTSAESWLIHKCEICRMFTHALKINDLTYTTVLINAQLLRNQQDELIRSPHYSQLFKIVVPSDNRTLTTLSSAVNSTSKDIEQILQSIENVAMAYLSTEKDAMNENIRVFTEKERAKYTHLQLKVQADKSMIVAAYLNLSGQIENRIPEDNNNLNDANIDIQELPSLHAHDDDSFLPPTSELPDKEEIYLQQRTSSAQVPNIVQQQPKDDVFDFDPGFQEDPSQPFSSQSDTEDDEEEDVDPISNNCTDTGSNYAKNAQDDTEVSSVAVFSTSVPINVPQWKIARQQSQKPYRQDHIDVDTVMPKDMAASIQALARSVHGDSATVFGELPKSRNRHAHPLSSQTSTGD